MAQGVGAPLPDRRQSPSERVGQHEAPCGDARAALEVILRKDSEATGAERDEAQAKLTAPTSTGGNEDCFKRVCRLAAAIEDEGVPLTVEGSDRRASPVRGGRALSFSLRSSGHEIDGTFRRSTRVSRGSSFAKPTARRPRSSGMANGWGATALRGRSARSDALAVVFPLAKAMDLRASALVGSTVPTFWCDASSKANRVDFVPASSARNKVARVRLYDRTRGHRRSAHVPTSATGAERRGSCRLDAETRKPLTAIDK